MSVKVVIYESRRTLYGEEVKCVVVTADNASDLQKAAGLNPRVAYPQTLTIAAKARTIDPLRQIKERNAKKITHLQMENQKINSLLRSIKN